MTRSPRSLLLHPVVIAGIVVLLVNDHVLKGSAPGWLTGKLSDFAGLAFTPLFIIGAMEFFGWDRTRRLRTRGVVAATVATGIVFALIELSAAADATYERALGILQEPWRLTGAVELAKPVIATPDPWDLVGLLALFVPITALVNRSHKSDAGHP